MTKHMNLVLAAMLLGGSLSMHAQQTSAGAAATVTSTNTSDIGGGQTAARKKKPVVKKPAAKVEMESSLAREIQELREKQATQQAQIDALIQANAAKDAQLQQANAAAAQAQAAVQTAAQAATVQAQTVNATVQQNTDAVQVLKSNVTDLQKTSAGLASTVSANKVELAEKIDSPTTLHYKGITITPVAFFAFEGVWRERSVNSDINTPFNSIPFPSANEGHASELNFTGRQSRVGSLFEGQAASFKLSGYVEADFLGTGTSSNNNQSNSYVLRQRQIWGQAATQTGFTITGGQMWSLTTEDGKGTDNRTEKLPNTVDSQYMVGFSWERQPSLRVQQKFGDYKTGAFTVALAVEQAQITNFTVASNVTAAIPVNFFFAGTGQNGGLYNAAAASPSGNGAPSAAVTTYANNVAPDTIVKFAYDNKYSHIEVGGLSRFLRDYYFPILGTGTSTAAAPVYTYQTSGYLSNTKAAGGAFGSARLSASKYADLAIAGMVGTGTGRYGSAQLADATLRPDGTLAPIKNYHGMFSLETHPAPKLDVYAYYGGEYAKRTLYVTSLGDTIGYGSPLLNDAGCYSLPSNAGLLNNGSAGSISATGTCQSPTKYIQEGMIGFTYRLVNSPKYGRLQYQATYSLINRQLWAGTNTALTPIMTPVSPRAQDSMIHFGMRYYIP